MSLSAEVRRNMEGWKSTSSCVWLDSCLSVCRYSHSAEVQVRLQFLTCVFSTLGSPDHFRKSRVLHAYTRSLFHMHVPEHPRRIRSGDSLRLHTCSTQQESLCFRCIHVWWRLGERFGVWVEQTQPCHWSCYITKCSPVLWFCQTLPL